MSRPVKTAARWSERRPAYLRPLLPLVAISAATLVLFAARPGPARPQERPASATASASSWIPSATT